MVGEVKRALEREAAGLEIQRLEERAVLPASNAAAFGKIVGALVAFSGIVSAVREPDNWIVSLVAGGLTGGFLFSGACLIQYVFDLRTLALRDTARRGCLGLVPAEKFDA